METKFNINREKVSDQEIESRKDFDALVKKFKEQSLQDAKTRKRLPKLRKFVYTTIIAGLLVVCTVSINELTKDTSNDKIATNVTPKNIIEDKSTNAFIKPIVKHTKSDYSKYKVNASKGGVINHPTKSKITIPQSAFVKKDGKEITGEVEIHYKEMHTIADVLVSGIPMRYDSAGQKQNFESAGMIDIKGFQNGEEVFIKPGKNLDVDMVSTKTGSQFNLYYLDTIAKAWKYIGKDKIVPLTNDVVHVTTPSEVPVSKEVKVITENIKKLDEKIVKVTEQKETKIAALPTPVEPKKPVVANKARKQFVLDVDFNQYPELKSFDGCVFEVGEENTHYTSEFNQIKWSDAIITAGTQKGKNYTLNLTSGYRKEKLIVYPVFTGKKLEEQTALYNSKLKEYSLALDVRKEKEAKIQENFKNELAKIEEERKSWEAKLAAEKQQKKDAATSELLGSVKNGGTDLDLKVRRLYQVNNFGVYNSDCARPFPQGITTEAEFVSDNSILRPATIFLISHSNNMLYTYTLADAENFKYDPKCSYTMLTSLNNKLYVCDKASFSAANKTPEKTTFTFVQMPMDVADAEELRKKLGV